MIQADKCDIGKLQKKETRGLFHKAVKEELVSTCDSGVGSINDRWTSTKHCILWAAKEVLGKETGAAKKSWIDE